MITSKDIPGAPRYAIDFDDWTVGAEGADASFTVDLDGAKSVSIEELRSLAGELPPRIRAWSPVMTVKKRISLFVLSIFLLASVIELGATLSVPGVSGVVGPAHAIIGRPLTPLSVAGVARRTTRRTIRRCAIGLYGC